MGDSYEQSNDRKKVTRLGEEEQPTCRTEKLLMLNSVAKEAGHKGAELPFEKVSCPPTMPLKERIGFEFELPEDFKESEDITDEDLNNFLHGINFEEEDVPINPSRHQPASEKGPTEEERDSRRDKEARMFNLDELEELTAEEMLTLELEVSRALPTVVNKESTMEAFNRLTQGRPWVPFKNPKEPQTELDAAECALFDDLSKSHDRHAACLNSAKGYKRFAVEWDRQVANRHKTRLSALDGSTLEDDESDTNAVIVNRKTYLQLQQHCDNLQSQKRSAALARPNDPVRERLETDLRTSRREMAPHQSATETQPTIYNHNLGRPQFGAPTALNATIAARAVRCDPFRVGNAPCQLNQITLSKCNVGTTGNGFNGNKCCCKCGFTRRQHNIVEASFGVKCTTNAGGEECSLSAQQQKHWPALH